MNKILQEIAAAAQGELTTGEAGCFEGRYLFQDTFCGFSGHFPGNPILPAIVEILTAVSLVGRQLGRRQRLVAVEDARFLLPVRPNQELLVRCQPRTVKGKQLYNAELTVAGTTSASLLLELGCAEDAL